MLRRGRQAVPLVICILVFLLIWSGVVVAGEFCSGWPGDAERIWVGPQYWANRLADWRIADGRLECVEAGAEKPVRTVHLLTQRLAGKKGEFSMSVRTGLIDEPAKVSLDSAAGFLIGAGPDVDYRAAALVHHSYGPGGGILALMESTGRAVFRDMTRQGYPVLAAAEDKPESLGDEVELHLTGKPADGAFELELTVRDPKNGKVLSQATLQNVDSARLAGNVALVSHPGAGETAGRFWFRDWKVSGSTGRYCVRSIHCIRTPLK
jgi:alkaline phosphatase D